MLRITRQTDYGIILLSEFAAGPEGSSVSARDLAGRTHLPLPMVGKILKALAQKGLLVSQRGARGGYSLARPPAQISLSEIIAALEGPIAMTECNIHLGGCNLEGICMARSNWQRINRAVDEALQGISLEDMTRAPMEAPAGGTGLLQIETPEAPAGRRLAGKENA
jgi:FeS assembly SUF system regulator